MYQPLFSEWWDDQLSKRLPNNSTIFAAEATAITLALDYYLYMDPVQHDVVVNSTSMSCLQVIESEDTKNPLICHIMNLLWALSDKGTHVCFCWVPSHCGIEGNEIVDQLARKTLDHDIDPLTTVHYADLKHVVNSYIQQEVHIKWDVSIHDIDPLTTVHYADLKHVVNSYIQQEVHIKWDVSIHGRDLYLLKPTLGPPRKFKHLTRAEEVIITRPRPQSHTSCPKDRQLLVSIVARLWNWIMLLECTVLQQIGDEYYTAESLRTLFEMIPEVCMVEFLREAGFFYLIWKAIYSIQHIRITHQLTKFASYSNRHTLAAPLHANMHAALLICLWGCVSSLNKSNPIQCVVLAYFSIQVPEMLLIFCLSRFSRVILFIKVIREIQCLHSAKH